MIVYDWIGCVYVYVYVYVYYNMCVCMTLCLLVVAQQLIGRQFAGYRKGWVTMKYV